MKKENGPEKLFCPGCGRELQKERCLYCGAKAGEKVQRVKEGNITIAVGGSLADGEGKDLPRALREKVERALRRGEGSVLEERSIVTEYEDGGVETTDGSPAGKILLLLEAMKREGFDTPGGRALSRRMTVDLILEAMRGMARDERLRFVAGELNGAAFSSYISEEARKEILSRLLREDGT